ncbi:fumarylacetoacetate (FAA) hydrolase family protein [Nocardia nova SH22a]|uniref:Fumarylacetoacetate (FAA) hydrolase family protein n=1 Tax=Nocardia nova SH22a TaxID=1415166 RepID=W5THE6_9NOCA|nr:fumarylacetoacetate hydrolase family protein [Nocardia nova]AHH18584.1 fumarylacetoacetate (FAA) hydrolase family protein [Nocardia nova SH22a]
MRIANIDNRLCLVENEKYVDVAQASDNRFGPDVQSVYDRWDEFADWFASGHREADPSPVSGQVGAPAPRPSQAFGVGLNYADHVAEADLAIPDRPLIFPKYSSCIAGPDEPLLVDNETVDWEAELVVVIGRRARHVDASDAWNHVAGLTVGQDISDRGLQWADPAAPEHGLAKSKPGYGVLGPVLVTPDEFTDRSDLAISCHLDGEQVQASRTGQLIFDIPTLISYLSGILTLNPGDVIFTGTPSGVGMTRTPPRYLGDGNILRTEIEGIGVLTTRTTTGRAR